MPDPVVPAEERLLVIRHGDLRGIVQSLGALQAIRDYHPAAHVTLLTTAPYAAFLQASGCADEVWSDALPLWRLSQWRVLVRRLHSGDFSRVYDLQQSLRSGFYFGLLPLPRPDWSGRAWGCSRPYRPSRANMHPVDRLAEQLRQAGIPAIPPVRLNWTDTDISRWQLGRRYALLAPGGRGQGGASGFWPVGHYATLARALLADGIQPALLGTAGDTLLAEEILAAAPGCRNLVGRTDLFDLVSLARHAAVAIGDDNGALHLLAAAGAPSLALFSAAADPAVAEPRGPAVRILRAAMLDVVPVEEVLAALALLERS